MRGEKKVQDEKKYEFTGEIKKVCGRVLHRIRALRDFGKVRKGDLGGWIEEGSNLSHKGNCWVYDEAIVCDNAKVRDNAKVYNKALVYDNAQIYGNAQVYGEATVYENAWVYGDAEVFDKAKVYGTAGVYGRARVYGTVGVYGNARIYSKAHVKYGELTKDIKEDLIQYIACSLNVYPVNGKYILYKRVNKIAEGKYVSLFDPDFIYEDGKIAEVKNYDSNFETTCSAGIHCSTPFYWGKGNTLIAVEVKVEDIITCMAGKVRAKKVKVLGEVGR